MQFAPVKGYGIQVISLYINYNIAYTVSCKVQKQLKRPITVHNCNDYDCSSNTKFAFMEIGGALYAHYIFVYSTGL